MKLLDFIPIARPMYHRPFHLSRLCEALDKVGTEPQRRIFWHGPRCGLTESLVAFMSMRSDLTFGYAAKTRTLTDFLGKRVGFHPADRLSAGCVVTGAILLDGSIPNAEQWDYLLTRVTPQASIFIFAQPLEPDPSNMRGHFLYQAADQGFAAGWV